MKEQDRAICTRTPWNCGGVSGSGIEMPNGTPAQELQPFRIREKHEFTSRGIAFNQPFNFIIQRGQLHGLRIPIDTKGWTHYKTAQAWELLYGYACKYTRNYGPFVMSRAARRRGIKSTDASYNRKATEYARLVRSHKSTHHVNTNHLDCPMCRAEFRQANGNG